MSVSDSDFRFLAACLRDRAGFVLESDKIYLVETRLDNVLARHGMSSISELVVEMRAASHDGLERQFIEAMLNNETTFFRDIELFHALRADILPALARSERTRPIDILCCACSTGQEPYSVAMLLLDAYPELSNDEVRIIATDFNRANLERARRGTYSQFEINRGLPAHLLLRHFEQRGENWTIRREVRERVEFREWNLLDAFWPIARADIVFLRNVMIYWQEHTKRRVLDHVYHLLSPSGFLILGGAETTLLLDPRFERVAPCCFQRGSR